MKIFDKIGVQIPQVLLPKAGVDMTRWAVVACDQFTSQPDYWRRAEELVGTAPSTLNMIFPEVYLEEAGADARIQLIQETMRHYLETDLLESHEGMVYVERGIKGNTRHGLVLCLDLERYDYQKGAQSLIRATEGTIIERLPPRMRIREGAVLELPHILVLIDDPQRTVIEPLIEAKNRLKQLYDFDLMLDSGHLTGYLVSEPQVEAGVIEALMRLAEPERFNQQHGLAEERSVLLFAMGDGNHSLATAKAIWEKIKPNVGAHHPARYALVEIENVHDEGLGFEPIHRVLFGVHTDPLMSMRRFYEGNISYQPCQSPAEMVTQINHQLSGKQRVGFISGHGCGVIEIANPTTNLPAGTLQTFLDSFISDGGAEKIDYVHGHETVLDLGSKPGNAGFFLPGMDKSDLFKTVILDGALPRKTFSMGEAREKRFYVECRRIT